ncbi:cytochrome P450 [Gilbertella persicaria]|uniref:sterol 22-desaturase n=1 Tax=Rhizopus stolonifer TaxID=4846 RepID=A0A367KSG0_RHIST|nr:cytochrome P450 [Gilbertella persicaria]KAI8082634.1 cytochrome P450 [Gilbertella persicaria]RCI05077.1 RNA polymerase C-22 sterol desaturase [Rhizopus stolonifer]
MSSSSIFDPRSIESAKNTVASFMKAAFSQQKMSTTAVVCSAVVGLFAYEQYIYLKKKKNLPGPTLKIPIIGAFMDSLYPTFEGYMSKWKSGELSCVSVFDRFVVIASTCDLSRKVLNAPTYAEPAVVDSMKYILCDDNWVFLSGKAHVDYRKGLNVLFTRKALGIYMPIQEKVYHKHFAEWLALDGISEQYQLRFRELNMESSLRVFLGDYMSDEVAAKISLEYFNITAALELVNFPIPLPGTKVYKAIQSRKYIVNQFIECIKDSRIRMANKGEIKSMMDAWINSMLELEAECAAANKPAPRKFTDREIALTLLTFLFASQDATSSALTWAYQLLADHPEVLQKVYDEQVQVRKGKLDQPLTLELMEESPYLRQVVKEILRLRPPVLMVPYQTVREWPLTPDYIVPKGAMLIPSTYPALHDPVAYPNPDAFDPDRWGPKGTAEKYPKNFMVFGNGPHHCLGREYAIMHLMAVIAESALKLEWTHTRTDKSDDISIFATIYPQDGCIMSFRPKQVSA